ncbi:amidase family protein [Streptomyces sp. NPDC058299]|uniref:amidase family protein n=1 Tax=Streptomyces sp. NPDC058299 TaxID=3346435 RepID=UPI0036E2F706
MGESTELSATRLAQAIRGRAVSPVDAVHAVFDRIEKVNPAVNASVTVCGERALVRTVADAALGVELMSGARPYDPYSLSAPEKLTDAFHCDLTGLTVAYSLDLGGYPVEPEPEPEPESVAQATLPAPREAGATVEEVGFRRPLPHADLTTMWRRNLPVAHAESTAIARDNGIDLLGAYPGSVDQGYLDSVRVGESLGAVDLRPEDLDRTRVPYSFEGLFDRYDLVVSPVNAVADIPDSAGRDSAGRDTVGPDTVEGQAVDPLVGWSLTSPLNLIGSPAASVPVGRAGNGVPVGLRLAACRRGDVLVIRAAVLGPRLPWAVAYQDLDLDATSA